LSRPVAAARPACVVTVVAARLATVARCIGMAEGKYETVSGTLDSETIQRVFNQEVSAIMRSRGFGARK
jgi:hypothetical protein